MTGKGAPGVSRRAVLLGFFALPIAAILEPEPALAQFGGLFGAVFGHRRYHHNSYHHQAHHRSATRHKPPVSSRAGACPASAPRARERTLSSWRRVAEVERTGRRQLPLNQVRAGRTRRNLTSSRGKRPWRLQS